MSQRKIVVRHLQGILSARHLRDCSYSSPDSFLVETWVRLTGSLGAVEAAKDYKAILTASPSRSHSNHPLNPSSECKIVSWQQFVLVC